MARYRGTFTAAANYEPLKAAPFDARELVETKNDLINPTTWEHEDGSYWTYTGMKVVVSADIDANNNGLYILIAEDYTNASNWRKCADERDVARILEEIENLEISSGGSLDVEVETEADLPESGDNNTTYYIKENNTIQRWDDDTQDYIQYGGQGGEMPEINLIYGGNANGNN